jgi:hypothetical protein
MTPSAGRTYPPPAYVINKLLRTLAAMRSVAERAPNPDPDLVKQHGERAVVMSSFAMLQTMAENAIEFVEEQSDCTLAKAEAAEEC